MRGFRHGGWFSRAQTLTDTSLLGASQDLRNLPGNRPTKIGLRSMEGLRIHATDGNLGRAYDFYFTDDLWQVRYLVVDTGHWLPGHLVLVPTQRIVSMDPVGRSISVALSQGQIKASPDADSDMPVSRVRERELRAGFDWTFDWGFVDGWVGQVPPVAPIEPPPPTAIQAQGDVHLRSMRELTGYAVAALDGPAGILEDLAADPVNWGIGGLVMQTGLGHDKREVWLDPAVAVSEISWSEQTVKLKLTVAEVTRLPECLAH